MKSTITRRKIEIMLYLKGKIKPASQRNLHAKPKMSFKTFVRPGPLVCRRWTCDYCGMPTSHEVHASTYQFGILACFNHADWAKRDVQAWWHGQGVVLVSDFCVAFPALAAVPNLAMNSYIVKNQGLWQLPIVHECSIQPLPVTDADMLAVLSAGFYLAQHVEVSSGLAAASSYTGPAPTSAYAASMAYAAYTKTKPAKKPQAVPLSAEELLAKLTTVVQAPRVEKRSRKNRRQQQSQSQEQSQEQQSQEDDSGWTTVKH